MADKQIIIGGVDVSGCKHFKNATCIADYLLTDMNFSEAKCELCKNCYYKQRKRKEQECEELHSRTASIIYNLTGGRLSYSTYTLEACEQAYHDQLEIDVERATKELQEELQAKEQALDEIEKYLDAQQKYFDGENYHNLLDIINKVKG